MSHDQKPGRMRVVGSGGAQSTRRRDDQASGGEVTPSAAESGAAGADASTTGRKAGVALAILFIAGCAIGGGAAPLLGLV